MPARPVRTARARLLTAATVMVAALGLTTCENGEGVRDEGPSAAPAAPSAPSKAGRCTAATTKITATEVPRPVDHLLRTVTDSGQEVCTFPDFPDTGFGPDRLVARPIAETTPKKPVKPAPGESSYAGVLLSAADGGEATAPPRP